MHNLLSNYWGAGNLDIKQYKSLDVSPRTTNSQKSKRSYDKAVNSPRANKERSFHVNMLLESVCIVDQKYILRPCFSLSLFLICSLISISFEARILIKLFL